MLLGGAPKSTRAGSWLAEALSLRSADAKQGATRCTVRPTKRRTKKHCKRSVQRERALVCLSTTPPGTSALVLRQLRTCRSRHRGRAPIGSLQALLGFRSFSICYLSRGHKTKGPGARDGECSFGCRHLKKLIHEDTKHIKGPTNSNSFTTLRIKGPGGRDGERSFGRHPQQLVHDPAD